MPIIISGIALLISMVALWMAVEARDKSVNGIGKFTKTCIGPLHRELEKVKEQIEELSQRLNHLAKHQAKALDDNVLEIASLRREITPKNISDEKQSNGKHHIS